MSASVFLTPAAVADLDDIWRYSGKTWGLDRADAYAEKLQHAIQRLGAGPDLSLDASDIRHDYRKLTVVSHMVFFKWAGVDSIVVVRILHQSMDARAHLRLV